MATLAISLRAAAAIAATVLTAAICSPAAAEPATPSSPPPAGGPAKPRLVFQRFYRASVSATRAAQHLVAFETKADSNNADIIGDAAQSASDAIIAMAAQPDGKRWLGQVHGVRVVVGAAPAVALRDGSIIVTVCPFEGVSGRPSSVDIQHAVETAVDAKSTL
jgi:hypothetical protein